MNLTYFNKNYNYFSQLLSVQDNLKADINVLDDKYLGNFNSDFFYAFSSSVEATVYLETMYRNVISKQLASTGFTFYAMNGTATKTYTSSQYTVDEVINDIKIYLTKMVFATYVKENNFSNEGIKQVDYNGEYAKESMYKYVYLLVTKSVNQNGEVEFDYVLKGNTCSADIDNNEQCIKVNLKIVKPGTSFTDINISDNVNTLECRMSGAGQTTEEKGSNCLTRPVSDGATYVLT